MFKAIAFGLAVGAGIQAWRNWPADGPTTQAGMLVVFLVGWVCAFGAGLYVRRRSGAVAFSHAEASAEAVAASSSAATVNLFVNAGARPAAASRETMTFPTESAAWIAGPRPVLDVDQLDGAELAEVLDVRDTEQA